MVRGEIGGQLNDSLKLLSDPYRRGILYTLKEEEDQSFDYDELVDEMIEQGYIGEADRQRFEAQLQHRHIPKMEESGAAVYDEENNTIRRIPDEDRDQLLEFIEDIDE